MGSALSGFATIGMGQAKAGAEGRAAYEDAQDEQRVLSYNLLAAGDAGRLAVQKIRMSGSQLIAQQKVGYAASGVAIDTGTPAAVMASQRALVELDALTAENNAARQAWGYKLQREQSKRNLQRTLEGKNREVIGSALSGAGQVFESTGSGYGGGG